MFQEAADAANAVRAQLRHDSLSMRKIGADLRALRDRKSFV